MQEDIQRYENNQRVRSVLIRHYVDLGQLFYTCTAVSVFISGNLKKDPTGEFSVTEIKSLLNELNKLPHIRSLEFDLENWKITIAEGNYFISFKKQIDNINKVRKEPLKIKKAERIQDVLDELLED